VAKLSDGDVRAYALEALGKIGGARAVQVLGEEFAKELSRRPRHIDEEVVRGLISAGTPDALAFLFPSLAILHAGEWKFVRVELRRVPWNPLTPEQRAAHAISRGDYSGAAREGAAAVPFLLKELEVWWEYELKPHKVGRASALHYYGRDAPPDQGLPPGLGGVAGALLSILQNRAASLSVEHLKRLANLPYDPDTVDITRNICLAAVTELQRRGVN
jgi:hypothetical protein